MSERMDRQEEVKEYGEPNGLKCVHFTAKNIMDDSDKFRAWINVWNYDTVAIIET